ncbi:hypothetical protein CA13_20600 [Planctomycetes bacterium CA13]|uniref:Uncharacterized protein n=1 Tax=Novipirellula herctigrandis TaxID=2527986 RepID=A0A5C5YZX4_9BACT|nr:hypothetical protein CA13_20600 [Planctomycetes bacterium CA13]
MTTSPIQCFQIGSEMSVEIFVFVVLGTYSGTVENSGASINHGLGHKALDGDLCVEDNDGTMISYRIPDMSGTLGTFVLGEKSFRLDDGKCFVLTPDYEAEQLPFHTREEALAYLLNR